MKIALIGYGKMGKEIEQAADIKNDSFSFKITSKNKEKIKEINLQNTTVAIEFTRPENAFENISALLKKGIPVVCGTTAWLDRLPEAKQIALNNNTALFYAPNYSLGVNLFFELNKKLAKLMTKYSDIYKVSIEEIHHTEKLDAPSGTAVKLAEELIDLHASKEKWVNHSEKNESELAIISKRIEGVPGTHSINYQSEIDELNLSHIAHSRKGFAQGALMAAHFIQGKKGYFEMKDLLEL